MQKVLVCLAGTFLFGVFGGIQNELVFYKPILMTHRNPFARVSLNLKLESNQLNYTPYADLPCFIWHSNAPRVVGANEGQIQF